MIVKYLTELLLDHECVIVPELGAFITKDSPAVLDYVNNILTPPSKELAFNGQLLTDDGLLIGYVAEKAGVSITEAANIVHDFAMRSLGVLEVSGVLRLDGIGVLARVTSKDYVFQLDSNLNLLGDAFGLTTLKAQPVYRRETYNAIAEKIRAEQKAKNTTMTVQEEAPEEKPHHVNRYNYKWFRAAAYSMLVAFALVLLGWGADKSDSKLASWNPLFYSSPNEFIAKHLDKKLSAIEFFDVECLPMLNYEIPSYDASDIIYLQPLDSVMLKPVCDDFYYIIGASMKSTAEAHKCVKEFQNAGFEGAVALPVNERGNIRVAYEMVIGRDAAIKRLEIIKTEYNKAAWLLRKK